MRSRTNLQSISKSATGLLPQLSQDGNGVGPNPNLRTRLTVEEVAGRLQIGRVAVYRMLELGLLPGIRVGRRWIVTRAAFEAWEKTCGTRTGTGFPPDFEVTV